MKIYKLILFTLITSFTVVTNAQNIAFPDINFKNALLNNIVDSNYDGEISVAEAEIVRILNIDNSGITNLSGIEYFTSLDGLSAKRNNLASIDLSQNIMLTRLDVSSNRLTSIDLSHNTKLILLVLKQNQIGSIDLSSNIELEGLYLSSNLLNAINVTNNTELTRLILDYNSLTTIDVSSNSKLEILSLLTNELNFINVSENNQLTELHVGDNNLDCINVQANINLKRLDLRQNNFVTLTIDNPTIELLDFRANQNLQSAFLEGPQFQTDPYFGLSFYNCTQLQNICVNEQYVQLVENLLTQPNYTTAVVSSNCDVTPPCDLITPCTDLVAIPDPNFEQALLDLNIDTDGVLNGTLCRADALATSSLFIADKDINDLTGIEAFINITWLSVGQNNLTTLDLSANTALINISANNNQLSTIDVSQSNQLKNLNIRNNQLPTLDVSQNIALEYLYCPNNNLSNLNTTPNTNLLILSCYRNQISNLDLSTNTALIRLFCSENQLVNLNLSSNVALDMLSCQINGLVSLDLSNNTVLNRVQCFDNNLTYLNLKNNNNTNLTIAKVYNNPNLTCIMVDNVAYANSQLGPILGGAWTKDATASFNTFCPETIVPGPIVPLFCNIYKNNFTMQWGAIQDVQGYQVEVTSSLQRGVITYNLPANQNNLTIQRMGHMSWRVRPVINGQGIWSEWKFKCKGLILIDDIFLTKQGINEKTTSNVSLYPNPVKKGDRLYINEVNKIQSLVVYTIDGQIVYSTKGSSNEINTANFGTGIYLIKIQTDEQVSTQKFIVN